MKLGGAAVAVIPFPRNETTAPTKTDADSSLSQHGQAATGSADGYGWSPPASPPPSLEVGEESPPRPTVPFVSPSSIDPSTSTPATSSTPGKTKTVIFIRHAESRWNIATKRPVVMAAELTRCDHGLTQRGYDQACALQDALKDALADGEHARESAREASSNNLDVLRAVTCVWASPLCRAMQTTLVGLLPVFTRPEGAPGLRLRPLVREHKKHGFFSRDNVGSGRGTAIMTRSCSKLAKLTSPPDEATLSVMRGIPCDLGEVESPWWLKGVSGESVRSMRKRARELLVQLQATDHSTVAVVSHSLFLRALFDVGLARDDAVNHPKVADALRRHKVPNCGVVVCTLTTDDGKQSETPLQQVDLCWPPDGIALMGKRRGRRPKFKAAAVSPDPGERRSTWRIKASQRGSFWLD
jgi:broad specificity phosphatase PhoE